MKILKRWWVWYVVCLLLVAFGVSIYIVKQNDRIPVNENYITYDKGKLYGFEDQGQDTYLLYMSDSDGQMQDLMKWDTKKTVGQDAYLRLVRHVPGWEDGDLFSVRDLSNKGKTTSFKLYTWNHETNTMDYMMNLSDFDITEGNISECYADQNQLAYYTTGTSTGSSLDYRFYHLEGEPGAYSSVCDGMKTIEADTQRTAYYQDYGWIVRDEKGDFSRLQNGETSFVFKNDGSSIGIHNVLSSIEDGYLIFHNIDSAQDVYVSYDDTEQLKTYPEPPFYSENGAEYKNSQFSGCRRAADGTLFFAFVNEQDNDTSCYFPDGTSAKIISNIQYLPEEILHLGMKVFFICMICGTLLLGVLWVWIRTYHAKMSLYLKIFLIMICLVSITTKVIYHQNYSRIYVDVKDNELDKQYRDALNYIMQMDLSVMKRMVDGDQSLTEAELSQLFQQKKLNRSREVYDMNTQVQKKYSGGLQFHPAYYIYQNGQIYLLGSAGLIRYPIQYEYSTFQTEAIQKSIEENMIVMMEYPNGSDIANVLVVPIMDDDANVLGAIEVRKPMSEVERKIQSETSDLRKYQNICYGILLVVLMLVLYIFLQPIKKLTIMAEQLGQGKLDTRLNPRGNDEISEITTVFNKMADGITKHMGELQRYTDAYSKFLPDEIFHAMGKENITEVALGDEANMKAATLVIGTSLYESMISRQPGQVLFNFINDALMIQLPLVKKNGGIVDIFENAGIRSYFTDQPEAALRAAVDAIYKIGRVRLNLGDVDASFQAVIGYGMIHVGVAGSNDRKGIQNLSEEGNLSGYLRKRAENYGADILVMEEAAKQIPLFGVNYRVRTLGYVRVTSSMSLRLIYEVFDTNKAKIRSAKEQTLDLYEDGVRLFFEGKAADARNCFVQVLRVNKFDKAAQRYFYLCDKYMNEHHTDYDRWIEEY